MKKEVEPELVHEISGATKDLYPIRPDDLVLQDSGSSDASTFGTSEVEGVAGHLIEFFKSRGYWSSFTIDELRRFYELKGWNQNQMFYGLIGGYLHMGGMGFTIYEPAHTYIVMSLNGTCYVTAAFIRQCITASKRKAA